MHLVYPTALFARTEGVGSNALYAHPPLVAHLPLHPRRTFNAATFAFLRHWKCKHFQRKALDPDVR